MINKNHERTLRLILNNHTSDIDTLLQNTNTLVTTIETSKI